MKYQELIDKLALFRIKAKQVDTARVSKHRLGHQPSKTAAQRRRTRLKMQQESRRLNR